jgi:hypothetical protein
MMTWAFANEAHKRKAVAVVSLIDGPMSLGIFMDVQQVFVRDRFRPP